MEGPHVLIKYLPGQTRDTDQFSYGVTGVMQIAQLIGFIVRVQAELQFRDPEPCGDNQLVITYNAQTGDMHWFVDKAVPVDALVGTLELIKCTLVDAQMAHVAQALQQKKQTGLVNSEGKPLLKG